MLIGSFWGFDLGSVRIFSSDSDSQLKEVQYLLGIILELPWIWNPFSPTIAPVVPHEAIYLFVQKEFQIVGMWIVYHVLVAHRIWIAKNESVKIQVLVISFAGLQVDDSRSLFTLY